MDSSQDRHDLHKIVVLNPKGGSGKTTLATNIASLFAKRGPPPTLIDCDPHGFSMQWLNLRPAARPKKQEDQRQERMASRGHGSAPSEFVGGVSRCRRRLRPRLL
jgi:cellulose biosynthesis protein BcsQ